MRWKLALVLLITIACLAVVLRGLDLDQAVVALRETRWPLVAGAVALYVPLHLMRSLRLWLLLGGQDGQGRRLRLIRVISITAVGFLAINVVPLRLGEAVRPWLLHDREGVPWGRSLAAVVMERIQDFAALLVMLLGVSWLVDLPAEGVVVQGVDVLQAGQRLAGTALVLGIVAGGFITVVGEPVIRLIQRLPFGSLIGGLTRRFREGVLELVRRPLLGFVSLLLTVLIWGTTLVSVSIFLRSMPGLPVSLAAAWTTWTLTLAGMTAVPTPGFFGAYELFCSAALWLFGVDPDRARTFAIVLHLGQFGFAVAIGAVAMVYEGLSIKQLVRPQSDAGL
ncbi:MAG: flippase-like domain-containing protein [Oligoflexia bacterium]|nr:flippase-like domain-containing protein [Oligoflexia bacterium]